VNAYNVGRTTRQCEDGTTPAEKAADFPVGDRNKPGAESFHIGWLMVSLRAEVLAVERLTLVRIHRGRTNLPSQPPVCSGLLSETPAGTAEDGESIGPPLHEAGCGRPC
jgi:hypothetical protein